MHLSLALSLLACTPPEEPPETWNDAFQNAAVEFGVSRDLLVATSYALTRLDHRWGMENPKEGAVGLMNLRQNGMSPSVQEAAEHLGIDPQVIVEDPVANIRGGAALLAGWAQKWEDHTGEPVDDLADWYPVVALYSGAPDPAVAEGFAAQVFDYLEWGLSAVTPDGEALTVAPQLLYWRNERAALSGSSLVAQFISASSSNYTNASRGPGDIDMIVIHTMEGSYSGSISWFQNSAAQASAHYCIRSSDGEITQMVDEEDVAWHAGYSDTNWRSVGIEHEGYVSDPGSWYTDAMYRSSAALVADIAGRNSVPIDRDHIIGHYEVPGCSSSGGGGVSCHTDPGSGWDWDYFLELVAAGGGTAVLESDLPDGDKSGSFSATITSDRYGVTRTCSGPVSGSASSGHLYLTATCTLEYSGRTGTWPITWTADALGSELNGRVVVDSYSDEWLGAIASDGSASASLSGSKDLGGDVGTIHYEAQLNIAR